MFEHGADAPPPDSESVTEATENEIASYFNQIQIIVTQRVAERNLTEDQMSIFAKVVTQIAEEYRQKIAEIAGLEIEAIPTNRTEFDNWAHGHGLSRLQLEEMEKTAKENRILYIKSFITLLGLTEDDFPGSTRTVFCKFVECPEESGKIFKLLTKAVQEDLLTVTDTKAVQEDPLTITDTKAVQEDPLAITDTTAVQEDPLTITDTKPVQEDPLTIIVPLADSHSVNEAMENEIASNFKQAESKGGNSGTVQLGVASIPDLQSAMQQHTAKPYNSTSVLPAPTKTHCDKIIKMMHSTETGMAEDLHSWSSVDFLNCLNAFGKNNRLQLTRSDNGLVLFKMVRILNFF